MKKTRFTDEQIAFALRQAETGASVQEFLRKTGNGKLSIMYFILRYKSR